MKPKFIRLVAFCVAAAALAASCDVRSETARREMAKFNSSPEPQRTTVPDATPIPAADTISVDTSLESATISIDGYEIKKSANCTKYDRVMVNGDKNVINVKGVCRQIMVNGDNNEVDLDAASEFVMNGSDNTVRHARYVNGKFPIVTDSKGGNSIEKVAAATIPLNKSK